MKMVVVKMVQMVVGEPSARPSESTDGPGGDCSDAGRSQIHSDWRQDGQHCRHFRGKQASLAVGAGSLLRLPERIGVDLIAVQRIFFTRVGKPAVRIVVLVNAFIVIITIIVMHLSICIAVIRI